MPASSAREEKSAEAVTRPAATMSGCATAVSLIVSASDSVPWADEVVTGGAAEGGQLLAHAVELEPRGEEAGGLGALSRADDR